MAFWRTRFAGVAAAPFALSRIDAAAGVTITAKAMDSAVAAGRHALASGGGLVVE